MGRRAAGHFGSEIGQMNGGVFRAFGNETADVVGLCDKRDNMSVILPFGYIARLLHMFALG